MLYVHYTRRNMKNKKIFITSFFILLILFTNFSFCLASESLPNTNIDSNPYYFVFKFKENTFLITTTNKDFVVGGAGTLEQGIVFYLKTKDYNSYLLSDTYWSSCLLSDYSLSEDDGRIVTKPTSELEMLYSNFNLKYDSYCADLTGNEYFFQKTPALTLLNQTLEEVEMNLVMKEILGLAKYLKPLLICLLSFWKGWKFFSEILHKA